MDPHILTLAAYRTEANKMKKEAEKWDKKVKNLSKEAQQMWRRGKNEIRHKQNYFEKEYHWLLSTGHHKQDERIWTKRRHDLSRAFISWRGAHLKNIALVRYKRPQNENKQGFTFP